MNLNALNAPAAPELSPESKHRAFMTALLNRLTKKPLSVCVALVRDNPECLTNTYHFYELVKAVGQHPVQEMVENLIEAIKMSNGLESDFTSTEKIEELIDLLQFELGDRKAGS